MTRTEKNSKTKLFPSKKAHGRPISHMLNPAHPLLKSSSSACYTDSSSSSNEVDEKLDEEGKNHLKKTFLAQSEDVHSSHDDRDIDAASDDGNLDIVEGFKLSCSLKGSDGEGSQKNAGEQTGKSGSFGDDSNTKIEQ